MPAPALPPPEGLDALAALVRYDDVGRALVTSVKYRGATASVAGVVAVLASLVPPPAPGTVVTWAPTTPGRARRRGFDQAEVLAQAVGHHLGLPRRRLLARRPGPHQTGRGARERHTGPAFTTSGSSPASVILVDDVCTTGATLTAAALALRAAGAEGVQGLVLARTPAREGRR